MLDSFVANTRRRHFLSCRCHNKQARANEPTSTGVAVIVVVVVITTSEQASSSLPSRQASEIQQAVTIVVIVAIMTSEQETMHIADVVVDVTARAESRRPLAQPCHHKKRVRANAPPPLMSSLPSRQASESLRAVLSNAFHRSHLLRRHRCRR